MWLLAIKAMLADRAKLVTTLLGIAFSVVLVNMQGGLLLGMLQKAALLVDYSGADIWVGHRHMTNVDTGITIPERWKDRIRGVDGVQAVARYLVLFSGFQTPEGRWEGVVVIGCDSDPGSRLGNPWVMAEGHPHAVFHHPDGIVIDVCDLEKLGACKVGDVREIGNHRARVVGMTRGIVSFTTSPYVFTTLERARTKYVPGAPRDHVSYFLVKARPGADVSALVRRIKERVPELAVYDRDSYAKQSMIYWMTRTGIGISFGLAAFLGLLVGLAVVAQTLYASVTERLKEFGTLKAMGADDSVVGRFLLSQALGSAALGSLVGLAASVAIGRGMSSPRAPVVLTWQVAAVSVGLIVAVCLVAAFLPYWRIRKIDPASVLRS